MQEKNYVLYLNTKSDFYAHTASYVNDAGIDLYFPEDFIVPGGNSDKSYFISLGISCEMKCNDRSCSYYLYPRSSISKTPLILANSVGIIDSGYRGEIMVAVRNLSNVDFLIKKGERLFQICAPDLSGISLVLTDTLSSSDRGANGFGSTGK